MSMLGADVYVYLMAGLAALGAVVVAVAPFLVLESTPKQGLVQAVRQPETDERPFWRRKRDFLRQTRNALGKLRSAAGGRLPVEALPELGKPVSEPLPQGTVSQPAASARQASQGEETPNADTELEPAGPQSPAGNLLDALSETRPKSDDSDSFEEDESDEDDKESGGLFGKDSDAKPADSDSLFELFSAEIVEDDEAGKLAATLDDVDARDLLSEAQHTLNEISRVRQALRRRTPPL